MYLLSLCSHRFYRPGIRHRSAQKSSCSTTKPYYTRGNFTSALSLSNKSFIFKDDLGHSIKLSYCVIVFFFLNGTKKSITFVSHTGKTLHVIREFQTTLYLHAICAHTLENICGSTTDSKSFHASCQIYLCRHRVALLYLKFTLVA